MAAKVLLLHVYQLEFCNILNVTTGAWLRGRAAKLKVNILSTSLENNISFTVKQGQSDLLDIFYLKKQGPIIPQIQNGLSNIPSYS